MMTSSARPPLALALCAVLAAGSLLLGCQNYDRLVELDTTCDRRWADMEAQLQRRGDLIPNLVATVKGSAAHEEKTLQEVTQARARATGITLSTEDLQNPEKVAAFQKAQDQLQGSLSRLLVSQERYPDLKANQAFRDLQVQLEGTENRILRAREQYNGAAADYNAELGKISGKLVKRVSGSTFQPRVYFHASAESQVNPTVKF